MDFKTWFQAQLKRREMTQAEFARKANIPQSTVNTWWRGARTPDAAYCDLIADALSVDLDTVLAVAGHRPIPDPLAADDPRADLIAMIKRIELTPDRLATLDSTLRTFLRMDRMKAEQAKTDQSSTDGAHTGAGLSRR